MSYFFFFDFKLASDPEESKVAALRDFNPGPHDGQRWAGISQEEKNVDWVHDCYFAAVGGDSVTFEALT